MTEEVIKTIENIDKMFAQIEVNGQVYESNRFHGASSTPIQTRSSSVQTAQGEDVEAVVLNNTQHDFRDGEASEAVEQLQQGLDAEVSMRQQNVNDLTAEVTALQQLLSTIQSRINEINVLIPSQASSSNKLTDSNSVSSAISSATSPLSSAVSGIEAKIPNQASSQNQLADKDFVNSSIATNTANFLGTYNSMAQIEAIQNPTNNDYAFLQTTDSAGNSLFDRYKYNAEQGEWLFEYELNNSSFTAEQWATINSGLTQESVDQDIADAIASIDVGHADTADKLTTARNLKVALGTTDAQSFDGSANATGIGVGGTLGVGNGGTGKTSASDALNSFINALSTGDSTPQDADYFVSQYVGGGATTTTYHRRPISKIWDYIKNKLTGAISEVLTTNLTVNRMVVTDANGKLTVATTAGVTGVKGNSESTYRTGNVNITKSNIGLSSVANTEDSATPASGGTKKFTTGGAYAFFANCVTALAWLGKVFGWALGKNWTQGTGSATSYGFNSVYYANGIWVAGCNSYGLWWSTDGKAWTQGTGSATSYSFNSVYYANGIWVAGCNSHGLWWSTNGKAWTQGTGSATSYTFRSVYYANGIWVAGSNSHGLWWSTDGKAWTQGTTGSATSYSFNSVYYANGIWVAGSSSNTGLWWSIDGKAWTFVRETSGYSFNSVYYANGIWVAGSNSHGLWWSTDGKAWIQGTTGSATSYSFNSVHYANGIWVAGSSGGYGLWWSTDGKDWSLGAMTSYTFNSVYYANGIWVAGSESQGLWYSDYTNAGIN